MYAFYCKLIILLPKTKIRDTQKYGMVGGKIREGSLEEMAPGLSPGSHHVGVGVCRGGTQPGEQYPDIAHLQGGCLPCPLQRPPPWNKMLSKYALEGEPNYPLPRKPNHESGPPTCLGGA